MTQTLLHGKNDNGFVLLRGLLVMFIILLCFASLLSGITIFSHHSAVLLERVEKEIAARNETVKNILR